MNSLNSKASKFSAIESAVICLLTLLALCWRYDSLQKDRLWDFRSYYFSTVAHEAGLNAYDYEQVNSIIPADELKISRGISYPYHPYTFNLFKPLTKFSFDLSRKIYLALNILSIICLVMMWRATICSSANFGFPILMLCLLFCPGSPLECLLTSGNIAAFEALLVWGGLVLLFRSYVKTNWLCLCAAGFWKVISFAYLPLTICWYGTRNNIYWLIGMLAVVSGVFLSPLISDPTAFNDWLVYLSEVKSEAYLNHSALLFFGQLATDLEFTEATLPLYVAWCLFVLIAYFRVTRRSNGGKITPAEITLLLFTAALIMPRLRPYGFIVLVPALQHLSVRWPMLLVVNLVAGIAVTFSTITVVANQGLFVLNILNWCFAIILLQESKKMGVGNPPLQKVNFST